MTVEPATDPALTHPSPGRERHGFHASPVEMTAKPLD
jgi:hypothetical protein